ncbi:MAG TPA: hypothetical protein ENL03_03630, partial [Phycisphaerae bacterium]|nr:hypothetical protein [Phycisphaerae bacterium]
MTELDYQVVGIAPSVGTWTKWGVLNNIEGNILKKGKFRGQEIKDIPAVAATLKGKLPKSFHIVGDKDRRVAKIFGATCGNDSYESPFYWDFNDINLNGPAVFFVDTNGIVQYEWYWRNHHARLGAATLLAIIKSIHNP